MGSHHVKVTVVVQQAVAVLDTECRDDEVYDPWQGDATTAQNPVIAGGFHGDTTVEHPFEPEHAQFGLDFARMALIAGTLQDLEQYEITDQDYIRRVLQSPKLFNRIRSRPA